MPSHRCTDKHFTCLWFFHKDEQQFINQDKTLIKEQDKNYSTTCFEKIKIFLCSWQIKSLSKKWQESLPNKYQDWPNEVRVIGCYCFVRSFFFSFLTLVMYWWKIIENKQQVSNANQSFDDYYSMSNKLKEYRSLSTSVLISSDSYVCSFLALVV